MKKFLFALFFILVMNISQCAYAYEFEVISNDSAAKIQDKISRIGFRILNANAIDKRMVFFMIHPKHLMHLQHIVIDKLCFIAAYITR